MPAYSTPDHEPIWVALLALLRTIPNALFVTTSRQHVQPPALSAEQQPALFVIDARETRSQKSGFPAKTMLSGFLVVYFQAPPPLIDDVGAETVVGGTLLNALLLAIDTAMRPDNILTGKLTLGGLVEHCWIEGELDKDTGIYTPQGAALLPLKILVP
jgi:hypothetical protein